MTAASSDVARSILKYFLRNPTAIDDAEGIARWRLLDQNVIDTLNETIEALAWLCARGYLTVQDSPTGAPLFRLNIDTAEAAQALLDQRKEQPLR